MFSSKISKMLAFSMLVGGVSANAADIFSIYATVDGNHAYYGGNNVESIIERLGNEEKIKSFISNYTDKSAALLSVSFRGLPINFSYNANSTTLHMNIPSLGINQSFTGATRDESQKLLEDWLKKDGGSVVEAIMKKLSEVSPTDPIAGNPNSLMSQTVANSFASGFDSVVKTRKYTQGSHKSNAVTIAAEYFSIKQDNLRSKKYSLPLAYSIVSDENPDRKYNIMFPLAMTDVEGAKVVDVGLGFSVNLPIVKNWTLTPAILYGATASADLGSLGQVATGSITSAYKFNVPGGTLAIGNMIGYSKTLKIHAGDYSYDPGISNTIFKNGLIYDIDTSSLASDTSLDVFVNNTAFKGSKLYVDNYTEFGFSYGFSKVKKSIDTSDMSLVDKAKTKVYEKISELRLGVSYLTSAKSKGFQVNFGYTF